MPVRWQQQGEKTLWIAGLVYLVARLQTNPCSQTRFFYFLFKVCGSFFPESCGLQKDGLYQCNGVGSQPSSSPIETCQSGCTITYPDSQCKATCSTPADKIVSLIDQAIETIDSSLRTRVLLQPFVSAFSEISDSLMAARNESSSIKAITGTVEFTMSSLYVIFINNKALFPDASDGNAYDVLARLFQEDGLLSLSGQLIDCAGYTSAQCGAADVLFHDYVDLAKARASVGTFGDDPAALAQLAADIGDFETKIDTAISSRNLTMLRETGSTLNNIIGRTLGNPAVYGDMWDYAILVYESAKEYLECKSKCFIFENV